MFCYLVLWLSIWTWNSTAQQYFQIEDIPIEHYGHDDHQNDEIDVELMLRSPRFLPPAVNTRNGRSDSVSHESRYIQRYFDELTYPETESRPKRDVSSTKNTSKVLEKVGQPLELLVIEAENVTKNVGSESLTKPQKVEKEVNDNVVINDFIRFKRSTTAKTAVERDHKDIDYYRLQHSGKFVQANPQGTIGRLKPVSIDSGTGRDNTRETRGATKEQWVKQVLPVQRDETVFDDNLQLSSDSLRAPRVHFVTNGNEERDPLEYKFDRQARSRSLNKYSPSDLSTEMDYYQPRIARNYIPRDRQYDRYPNGQRDTYRQDYPDNTRNYNSPDFNKKRRIIYYATLPEIPRNSRDDDYNRYPYDRFIYRDRYDDRYPDRHDNYRNRYYDQPRYDDDRPRDLAYPVKVTTDVKVREVKKNPERRIYSDVDRTRYIPS